VKLLVVTSRFPYPIERGDKLRAFHQIRQLAGRHEVVLVALTERPVPDEHLQKLRALCARVHVVERSRLTTVRSLGAAALRGEPLQVGYFQSPRVQQRVRSIIADERPDHVYCQLVRTAEFGRDLSCPTTLDYQDAFSAAARRRAGQSVVGLRQVLRREARLVGRYEAAAFDWFDNHLIISEQDRSLLEFPAASEVHVIPNGVDVDYFRPGDAVEEDQRDVVFVGNMGYPPNVAAATTLANRILPLIQRRRPSTDLLIAGARPNRSVRRLAGPQVEVTGWMDDIRTGYRRGRVLVAPLVIGAGQQNKILEAMAMGVPCVTTELVNNAIGAEPGREILLASSVPEFAERSLELLESAERRREVADAALAFARREFSWAVVGERLDAVLRRG
jgi:polysaccharide biosynthesis protein PslH